MGCTADADAESEGDGQERAFGSSLRVHCRSCDTRSVWPWALAEDRVATYGIGKALAICRCILLSTEPEREDRSTRNRSAAPLASCTGAACSGRRW